MYLAVRSLLHGAPVLIYFAFKPTTRSAIKWSSVSPLLCDTITFQLLFYAKLQASILSYNVPI